MYVCMYEGILRIFVPNLISNKILRISEHVEILKLRIVEKRTTYEIDGEN